MNDSMAPQVVRTYVAALESALNGVPEEVSHDIIAGVSEELEGLTASDAAVRIEALGDPMFIAAEARSSSGIASNAAPQASVVGGAVSPVPGYAIVAVLLIILGGYVVPFVGWVVGLVLLWASPIWSNRDKWAGTLYGPAAGVVGGLLIATPTLFFNQSDFAWWHIVLLAGLILPFFANVVVGIRLLRRARTVADSHL